MQLFEHYQQLLEKYEQKIKQKWYPSVDEIADCLNISTRYTKMLLKQMNEVKWISWLPQRGRGKKSTLILNLSKNDILVEQALQKLKKGDFTDAVKIMKQLPSGEYPNLLEEFQRHLGIQEEKVLDDSKDIFRYAFYQSIISLDPALILSRHEAHIAEHIYDTLVIYNEEHKSIVPHLAHQWEVDREGINWIFHLRKGVLFHHGRELDAKDVFHTMNRLKNLPERENKQTITDLVKDIIVINKRAVQFVLKEPNHLFLHYLTLLHTAIIPIEVINHSKEAFGKYPIGTGPYKITQNDDTMVVLNNHPVYFKGRTFLDQIEMINLPELYPSDSNIQYHLHFKNKHHEQWETLTKIEEGACYLTFNEKKHSLISCKETRDILINALNTKEMERHYQEIGAVPAHSFIPNRSKILQKKVEYCENSNPVEKIVNIPKQSIHIYATEIRKGANYEKEARWIKKRWEQLGVDVYVHIISHYELAKPSVLQNADVIVTGLALSPNQILALSLCYQSETFFISNILSPDNSNYLKIQLDYLKTNIDFTEQFEILYGIEDWLKNNKIIKFLYHRYHHVDVKLNSRIKGIELTSNGRVGYKELWIK
ncbi:ABC transporter substrate-binding protein [Heyndrickxia oleronia]|uniref:ABC transporter substrate-binding protein n=1 Tax=Heyndrickxia oleronia TaxID=38875 RepID=A0A8E2I3G7_9BACI|nr:ABC transporter substrate-binding protein [Heyndrickxia oleronia]MEC1376521.1 ABC transporter substrate-binding protein [Heyndrickxia oleronia]OOP66021.1 hypothetical protein BWZ43_23140 [Heyndrickxia oleronia]QQZ07009.1 SgrR family transcriptional regulator [Heyndrickxia oleronia]